MGFLRVHQRKRAFDCFAHGLARTSQAGCSPLAVSPGTGGRGKTPTSWARCHPLQLHSSWLRARSPPPALLAPALGRTARHGRNADAHETCSGWEGMMMMHMRLSRQRSG
eukprot:scaffold2615_cov18-Tisochrysis_lutea.AAC.1